MIDAMEKQTIEAAIGDLERAGRGDEPPARILRCIPRAALVHRLRSLADDCERHLSVYEGGTFDSLDCESTAYPAYEDEEFADGLAD